MGDPSSTRRGRPAWTYTVSTAVLVAVLVGSAGSEPSGDTAAQVASPSAGSSATPPASVTLIKPLPYPRSSRLPAAVRIAATSVTGQGRPARVDIAGVLLAAYRSAAAASPASCHLPVSLLAGIGQVESGSLVGVRLDARHRASILGPLLDGQHGLKAVADTDHGRWDGNARWDRAVGPMQFIPGTWRRYAVDGDGDGVADPQDVEDATATAAAYLCAGGRDLAQPGAMRAAVLAYNSSDAYARLVLTYQKRFASLGLDRSGVVTGLSTVVAALGGPIVGSPTGGPTGGATGGPTGSPAAAPRSTTRHTVRHTTGSVTPTRSSPSPVSTPSSTPVSTPSSTPSSTPTAKPSPSPSPTPTPSGSPSPTGQPTADPTTCPPVPTPTATPSPTADPSPGATATCPPCGTDGSPTPTATPSAVTGDACPPVDSTTAASPSAAP